MYTTLTAIATGSFALAVGILAGALLAIKLALATADLLRGDTPPSDPDAHLDEEDERADMAAIGRLMVVAAKFHNWSAAGFEPTAQDRKALRDALTDAEDRFYDCLEEPFLEELDAEDSTEPEPAGA